ncbi:MAG: 4Fe-4S dicluster domain-containing protein [Planctomycetia bacterium]
MTPAEPPCEDRSDRPAAAWHWLDSVGLESLIDLLRAEGHRVVGPQVADGAIVYRDLDSAAALPTGWIDEQDGGLYQLRHDPSAGTFDHVVGPHSLKNFLFPAQETFETWHREPDGWRKTTPPCDPDRLAVIGVRGCDLAALAIQDRVFLGGDAIDVRYKARRERLFLVAVNCRRAAATCFCHSMGCGPAAGPGHDLAVTEIGGRFAVETVSQAGSAVIHHMAARIPLVPLTHDEIAEAIAVPQRLRDQMNDRRPEEGTARPRSMDTDNIRDLLFDNLEHPRWRQVADRCLSCANCTLVCPTCFCSSVTEVTDLTGDAVSRERRWASCFTLEHSQMHAGNARPTTASRYRQWLTHKLAGWIDQFGTSGCTGCGRCITWCPVGIDITEEVAAIREPPAP